MDTLWQDLRYSIRMLWKAPGFTAIAVISLALGIGANTAIFSILNGAMLRPLAFKEADSAALILSAIGIYGVMSYFVSQRTREIGIRMALGGRSADVLKLVIRHGLLLTGVGLVVGAASAFALTGLIARFLFGISRTDPLTFIGMAFLLAAVALLATYVPARRAAHVDPLVAVRQE